MCADFWPGSKAPKSLPPPKYVFGLIVFFPVNGPFGKWIRYGFPDGIKPLNFFVSEALVKPQLQHLQAERNRNPSSSLKAPPVYSGPPREVPVGPTALDLLMSGKPAGPMALPGASLTGWAALRKKFGRMLGDGN